MLWGLAFVMALAVCSSVAAAQTSNVSQGQKNVQGATSSPNENEDVLLPPEGVSPDKVQPSTVPAASAETPEPTVGPAQSPVNQPSNTVTLTPQPQAGREPEKNKSGIFVFRTEVQEVTLHATVVDNHQRPVTTLDRSAFHVLEDGKPQRITSFRREDIPVALGIVIDNSGSMRDKRPSVNAAALNLVKASNPQDQVFVVNFNDEYYLDQDYTGNVSLLQDALERVEARGGTALYDAVVASSGHLLKSAKLQKKIILVVTDGEDTASRETLEKAVRTVAVDGGPTIYTIGLLAHERGEKRARRALQILAEQTGGVAFFPGNVNEVEAISQQIAHDIRNQYTIGYKPSSPKVEGAYRQVKVDASASGFKKLTVRTRSGYYATGGRAATASSKPDTKQGKPAGRSN